MKYNCVFMDIDGTFIPYGHTAPPDSAVEALHAARNRGVRVVMCTGRCMGEMAGVDTGLFDGIIASMGAYVEVGGCVLRDEPLKPDECSQWLHALRERGVLCTIEARNALYGDDASFVRDKPHDATGPFWSRRISWIERTGVRPMEQYDGSDVYKILVIFDDESQFDLLKETAKDNAVIKVSHLVYDKSHIGEVYRSDTSKGVGIRAVCEYLNADPMQCIGFGDSINDMEMLDAVGYFVCMGDGSEELKALSDYVCPSAADDGIMKGFKMLGLTSDNMKSP